ncbi:hypothetical protein HJFPF1_05560 [Paramyrothecium foliicola]|nr:hypothetical protein HJFPF1_05560 [Paramyrothecium foliicola]
MAGRLLSAVGAHVRSRSPAYQGLPASEPDARRSRTKSNAGAASLVSRMCRNPRWVNALLAFALCALLIHAFSPYRTASVSWGSQDQLLTEERFHDLAIPDYNQDAGGDRRLRIFMPADTPNINLCKAIMSAVALGYPLPTLLNWNGEFNRPEWHFAGSHIAKLESLLSVIEALLNEADKNPDVNENDLAILVDAYDIWFQLPPSVLIQRYHQLNREANERLRKEWEDLRAAGVHDFPIPPPRQSIIVTTAKDCEPGSESGSNPHYEHWPQSPMPTDMYGDGTDQLVKTWDPARKYRKIRPRCVNSGMVMGTMGSLRKSLLRAKEKIEDVAQKGRQLWSDQALYAEVIGDQELWREWVRGLISTWNGTESVNEASKLPREVRNIAQAALKGKNFEFGIGLDYNFTTIPATCSAEEDGYFVQLDDKDAVQAESIKAGVPDGVRVAGIPVELRGGESHNGVLKDVEWGQVPLYTDFYFGVTPVGIHHNAYVDGLKSWRVKHWWNMTWFYPELRKLVTTSLQPLKEGSQSWPLLTMRAPTKDGQDVTYYTTKSDERTRKVTVFEPAKGSSPAKFTPIEWDGVCQKGNKPWYDELFGDRKGPLVL